MANHLPTVTRTYRSWVLDSRRWQQFESRPDDIVVATPYKSGTTWMIHIVGQIIFNDLRPREHRVFGRWPDANFGPFDEDARDLAAMTCRRVMKTHLALDGLPYDPRQSYIYVGRDLRDIFMSLWNHHTSYTAEMWQRLSDRAEANGLAVPPPPPASIHEFWAEWITRGQFEWENEGYPYWSTLHHLRTWWTFRHLPNILFVHFNELLADLPGQVARVAEFLGYDLGQRRYEEIATVTSFTNMKAKADLFLPGAHSMFRGGGQTFLHEGTNGRWREVLTPDDLVLYHAAVARNLPPDAAHWLQTGEVANPDLLPPGKGAGSDADHVQPSLG